MCPNILFIYYSVFILRRFPTWIQCIWSDPCLTSNSLRAHTPCIFLPTFEKLIGLKKIYWTGLVLPICTRMKGYPLDRSPSTRGHPLSLSWYTLIANIPSVMGEPLWALPSSILESGLTSSRAEKHSCHELMSASSHVSAHPMLVHSPSPPWLLHSFCSIFLYAPWPLTSFESALTNAHCKEQLSWPGLGSEPAYGLHWSSCTELKEGVLGSLWL